MQEVIEDRKVEIEGKYQALEIERFTQDGKAKLESCCKNKKIQIVKMRTLNWRLCANNQKQEHKKFWLIS